MVKKIKIIILSLWVIIATSSLGFCEVISFKTFMHEPSEVFDRLRLIPNNDIDENLACDIGSLYVNSAEDNFLQFCHDDDPASHEDGAWGRVPGIWTQAGDIYDQAIIIHPTIENDTNDINLFLGIGTTAPSFKLHLDNDGMILAEGTIGSGENIPDSLGVGTRLIWCPKYAAFRAGGIVEAGLFSAVDQWDSTNVGYNSFATGLSTIASADYSTAMGDKTQATGEASIAMGKKTVASGNYSTAIGIGTTSDIEEIYTEAEGNYSFASGKNTTAKGDYSIAMGEGTTASSFLSWALGKYNVGATGNTTDWSNSDTIFEVGGGTSGNKSNLFTITKEGKVGIGTENPLVALDIVSGPMCIHRSPVGAENDKIGAKWGQFSNDTLGADIKFAEDGLIGSYNDLMFTVGSQTASNGIIYFGKSADGSQEPSSSNIEVLMSLHEANGVHPLSMRVGYVVNHTIDPTYPFEVVIDPVNYPALGTFAACDEEGHWIDASDVPVPSSKNKKQNIKPLKENEAIKAISNLCPVSYTIPRAKNDKRYIGFIAEDMPQLLAKEADGTLNRMQIGATLTKVIQYQQKEIEKQNEIIENQQKRIKALKEKLKSELNTL